MEAVSSKQGWLTKSRSVTNVSLDVSGEAARTRASQAGGLTAIIFEETQYFPSFIYVLLVISLIAELLIVGTAMVNAGESAQTNFAIVAFGVVITCFVFNMLVLRTRVDASEIYICLGWLPIFWTRIPLSSVEEPRVVTYHPLRDAGGWGMRFGRFEGAACRYWNARGNQGVFFATAKHRYIIGSQQSENLYRALSRSGLNGIGGR